MGEWDKPMNEIYIILVDLKNRLDKLEEMNKKVE